MLAAPGAGGISLDSKICRPQIFGLGTGSLNFVLKIFSSAVRSLTKVQFNALSLLGATNDKTALQKAKRFVSVARTG